ncbi:MAG: hypothetical protein U0359_07980 [Byssovorax sp.]
MSTPEDLVVFKAIAGRPKDIEDAEALLVLHPSIDIARARRRVIDLAELAEAPEMVASFDGITARARGAPADSAPGTRSKTRASPEVGTRGKGRPRKG